MDDVGESLEKEDGCDHVVLAELGEGLDTNCHELLSFLICTGGEIFQHFQQ